MKKYPRIRNRFDPRSTVPFRLSRSRLENFVRCPRCFYLDRRLGIEAPSSPPYTLNQTVDLLFKREFDACRARKEAHPLMKRAGIPAVPLDHPSLDDWRNPFKGIQYRCREAGLLIFGGIDDLWIHEDGSWIVVDYKATSSPQEKISLEDPWKAAYKRQIEIYQWLFKQNGCRVYPSGYFVYANALQTPESFDGVLRFEISLLEYKGSTDWVSIAVKEAAACLQADRIPAMNPECEYCLYLESALSAAKGSSTAPELDLQGPDSLSDE